MKTNIRRMYQHIFFDHLLFIITYIILHHHKTISSIDPPGSNWALPSALREGGAFVAGRELEGLRFSATKNEEKSQVEKIPPTRDKLIKLWWTFVPKSLPLHTFFSSTHRQSQKNRPNTPSYPPSAPTQRQQGKPKRQAWLWEMFFTQRLNKVDLPTFPGGKKELKEASKDQKKYLQTLHTNKLTIFEKPQTDSQPLKNNTNS